MSATLLSIQGLRKSFGERRILDLDRLQLEAGACYVLTGENGAGKSTLLRIVAGLEPADMADYEFDGRDVPLPDYPGWLRREVIYMHQHPYLFHTSVAHNIEYGLKMRRVPRRQRALQVAEAMDWAGVAQLAHVPPHKLSGGEKQRVALARVKVLSPRLYLFDEPTANLDADARAQTVQLIERLARENNCVLVACHDQELINLPHVTRLLLAKGTVLS